MDIVCLGKHREETLHQEYFIISNIELTTMLLPSSTAALLVVCVCVSECVWHETLTGVWGIAIFRLKLVGGQSSLQNR